MQCQVALQVRVHSTSVFSASALNDGLSLEVSPPLSSGRAHCPVRGYILAVVYDDSPFTYGFTDIHIYIFPIVCGVSGAVCCGSG